MFRRLIHRIGRARRCRNTRLQIDVDYHQNGRNYLLIRMIDKCTGMSYEATFSPETAVNINAELTAVVSQLR